MSTTEENKKNPNFEKYIQAITPKLGDPTYSILRSHLHFEEMMRENIDKTFAHPEALEGARLTFAQILKITKAINTLVPPNNWIWKALDKHNKLRNSLGHKIHDNNFEKELRDFIKYVIKSIDLPIPNPENPDLWIEEFNASIFARVAQHERPHVHTAIDIALSAVNGTLRVILKEDIERKERNKSPLPPISNTN